MLRLLINTTMTNIYSFYFLLVIVIEMYIYVFPVKYIARTTINKKLQNKVLETPSEKDNVT